MRIRATDVTAAYRSAVQSARFAGVDTEGWTLKRNDTFFTVITRDPETHSESPVFPGHGSIGVTMRQAYDTLHAMRAAWDMVPRANVPGKWPCWHVKAGNGLLYGVAATTREGAFAMVNARLADEGVQGRALSAEKVDTWETTYGNVFCYGEA